jgi:hypothetical protein
LTSPQTIATILKVVEEYDKLAELAVAFRRRCVTALVSVNPRSR